MKKFEYRILEVPVVGFCGGKIESEDLVVKLNELGEEGWELSTSFSTSIHQGKSNSAILILKRESVELA